MRLRRARAGGTATRRSAIAAVGLGLALAGGTFAPAAADAGTLPAPTDLRVVVSGSPYACAPDVAAPVRTATPLLRARVSTPGGTGNVAASWEVRDATGTVVWGPFTGAAQGSGSDQAVQVGDGVLAHDGSYRWVVAGVDADGNRGAEVSCGFTVDLVAPSAPPTVTPVEGEPAVYLEDRSSGGIGVRGSFAFGVPDEPSSADVVAFLYSFDSSAMHERVDASAPTVSFAPTTLAHTLYVQAVDAAGWTSPVRVYRFSVGGEPVLQSGLSGRVTDPDGAPLADVVVEARDGAGAALERTTTDGDGVYALLDLAPGTYVVAFLPPADGTPRYLPEFYDDAATADDAEQVTVFRQRVRPGIDAQLAPVPVRFTDVPEGAPFAEEIGWLQDSGISRGTLLPDGTRVFQPAGPVTREAMAAFLYRAAGSPEHAAPGESPFVDVPVGAPFYAEITWLHEQGITTGTTTPAGVEFRPSEGVTREAMAAFLYRGVGSPDVAEAPPFTDVPADHPFATEVAWLASAGISTGSAVGDGTFEFRPSEVVRREAMAAFLYRARAL